MVRVITLSSSRPGTEGTRTAQPFCPASSACPHRCPPAAQLFTAQTWGFSLMSPPFPNACCRVSCTFTHKKNAVLCETKHRWTTALIWGEKSFLIHYRYRNRYCPIHFPSLPPVQSWRPSPGQTSFQKPTHSPKYKFMEGRSQNHFDLK